MITFGGNVLIVGGRVFEIPWGLAVAITVARRYEMRDWFFRIIGGCLNCGRPVRGGSGDCCSGVCMWTTINRWRKSEVNA